MTATSLNQDLESFLSDLSPACIERVSWRGGQIELANQVYLTDRPSLPALTSSGRCIVVSRGKVLLMSNPTDTHILPGGRIEPGETIAEATRREVLEETGLHLAGTPADWRPGLPPPHARPAVYKYPYPIFLNTIHVAKAANPERLLVNDTYEIAGEFLPFDEVGIADRGIPARPVAGIRFKERSHRHLILHHGHSELARNLRHGVGSTDPNPTGAQRWECPGERYDRRPRCSKPSRTPTKVSKLRSVPGLSIGDRQLPSRLRRRVGMTLCRGSKGPSSFGHANGTAT